MAFTVAKIKHNFRRYNYLLSADNYGNIHFTNIDNWTSEDKL